MERENREEKREGDNGDLRLEDRDQRDSYQKGWGMGEKGKEDIVLRVENFPVNWH